MLPFLPLVMSPIMIALLMVHRRVTVVPGVLPYLAFVAWVVPCAVMLDSSLRAVGYAQRFSGIVMVGVVLLYVVNARSSISMARVVAGLCAVWGTVIVGGYFGMFYPDVRLRTPVGMLLPASITSNAYVQDLVLPPFAEVQQPWGAPSPFVRPAAPFPYTNSWGTAIALLTPVALAALSSGRFRPARGLLLSALVAASVPAVWSQNRGMFVSLAVAVAYVSIRLALRGRVGALLTVAAVTTIAVGGFAAAGLTDSIAGRQEYSDTTAGRASIYKETFLRTLESPLFGYGAPRPSSDSGISAGTQGHVWMLMFSYGFVGLGLFLIFLWGATVRTARVPNTASLWLHSSLVVACVCVFFYGLDLMQMLTVALVAAVLLRERYVRGSPTRVGAGVP
jgi:hypothetical protein